MQINVWLGSITPAGVSEIPGGIMEVKKPLSASVLLSPIKN